MAIPGGWPKYSPRAPGDAGHALGVQPRLRGDGTPKLLAYDDVASAFAGWIAGDDAQTTGRAMRLGDDAPAWVRAGQGRVIAEAEGVKLYVSRGATADGPVLQFTLGDGTLHADSPDGWAKRFEDRAVLPLGRSLMPGGRLIDERGQAALLGVSARPVAKVELRHAEGASTVSDADDGGFVLIADATRPWRGLIAYDAGGRELERVDVRSFAP